jgi:hypothetical protein
MKASFKNLKDMAIPGTFHDLELVNDIRVLVNTKGGIIEPVSCQVKMGRSASATVVHAAVWIAGNGHYAQAHDTANGGGYCKVSSAIAGALTKAGVELSERISGVGEEAVREALIAITRKLGYSGSIIVVGI